MTTPSLPSDLLTRFIAGEATTLESARVQQWIDADPRRGNVILALQRLSVRSDDRTNPPSLDALWETIGRRHAEPQPVALVPAYDVDAASKRTAARPEHSAVAGDTGVNGTRADRSTSRLARPAFAMPQTPVLLRGWLSGALTTIAVIALGIFVVRAVPSRPRAVATHATYATSTGQLATVTLRDGSRITLAPRTTLTVSSDFGTHDRAVTLVGEAHFDVQPNHELPFVVRTGAVVTRVLGTMFDLRHYADDSVGRVVVFSGKVASGARTGSMTLTAGMAGRFTDSAVTGATANDSTIYTDWVQGRLVFRDAPINVILTTLRQWYGYEFRLTDSTLATRHYSAVFLAGDADEMFKVVSHMLGGVSMTRQDSVIILRPNRNVTTPARDTRRQHTPFHTPTEVGR